MSMIVTVQWFKNELEREQDIVGIDTRFQMNDPAAGRQLYEDGHIPQAIHLDLKKDLSSPTQTHGGSNPLPDPEVLAKKLGSMGIDEETIVVIYDETNGMFASRTWWLMHYIGLERIHLLDGGLNAWREAGYELTTEIPVRKEKQFEPKVLADVTVNINDVKEKLNEQSAILLDSRSHDRYLGKTEPLYEKAGHIPGAKNFFHKDVFTEDGSWKNAKQIQEVFSSLPKDEEIIVSCGSGVSACTNIIGLKRAGYENVKLYPGSFSDWISYEENKVEKKDE